MKCTKLLIVIVFLTFVFILSNSSYGRYVNDNPVNYIDPWGLHPWPTPGMQRPHTHENGSDWDPHNLSPSTSGINSLPHPYADMIFEETGKAVAEMYIGFIPYAGPVIQNRDLIRAVDYVLTDAFIPPSWRSNEDKSKPAWPDPLGPVPVPFDPLPYNPYDPSGPPDPVKKGG